MFPAPGSPTLVSYNCQEADGLIVILPIKTANYTIVAPLPRCKSQQSPCVQLVDEYGQAWMKRKEIEGNLSEGQENAGQVIFDTKVGQV